MRYFYTPILVFIVSLIFLGTADLIFANHAEFDPNNLIEDGAFVNIDDMNVAEIQSFLEQQKSFLKDYSENGRTAAQIIWGAAHGYGDATGATNGITIDRTSGTVSPRVILVTLEKEQGLISKKTQDDNALRKAMGFACPDGSSCNPDYAGFTKQIEVGAWQLRYNFERARDSRFSNYQVGQTQCFDDSHVSKGTTCVTFANRATTALYRYTPHVYNGNHRFHELFTRVYLFTIDLFDATLTSQSAYVTIWPGQTTSLALTFRNTGSADWDSMVRLAIDRGWESGNQFKHSSWWGDYRITRVNTTVRSGEITSFTVPITAPETLAPGQYRLQARLVRDGVTWFEGDSAGAWWTITVPRPTAELVSQSSYPTLRRGQDANVSVTFRNTSGVTWPTTGIGVVRLAVDKYWSDRTAWQGSGWLSENRIITAQQGAVGANQTATYSFSIHVPVDMPTGEHRFYARLVADGLVNGTGWFDNPDTNGAAWWKITVVD